MKRQAAFAVVFAVVVALITSATPVFSQSWSSSTELSLDKNPNGNWSYGFIDKEGKFTLYNTIFDDGQGIKGWCLDDAPDAAGNVLVNVTKEPIDRYGVWWEPGKVCVQPGLAGLKPVIRWTAPSDCVIKVAAAFSSNTYSTSASVQVLQNGKLLDESSVDGFTGKGLAKLERKGAYPERIYSATLKVADADVIDFLVDHNGPWRLNQTGVDVEVSLEFAKKDGEAIALDPGGFTTKDVRASADTEGSVVLAKEESKKNAEVTR